MVVVARVQSENYMALPVAFVTVGQVFRYPNIDQLVAARSKRSDEKNRATHME